jgi:hypothetical protein
VTSVIDRHRRSIGTQSKYICRNFSSEPTATCCILLIQHRKNKVKKQGEISVVSTLQAKTAPTTELAGPSRRPVPRLLAFSSVRTTSTISKVSEWSLSLSCNDTHRKGIYTTKATTRDESARHYYSDRFSFTVGLRRIYCSRSAAAALSFCCLCFWNTVGMNRWH